MILHSSIPKEIGEIYIGNCSDKELNKIKIAARILRTATVDEWRNGIMEIGGVVLADHHPAGYFYKVEILD